MAIRKIWAGLFFCWAKNTEGKPKAVAHKESQWEALQKFAPPAKKMPACLPKRENLQ
jgi:hypothetical protein